MNTLVRFGFAALIVVVAIQSASALRCFVGGQAGGVRLLMEKTCSDGENLCQFQNGTMNIKIAKGCAFSTDSIKAVSRALKNARR